MELSIISRVQAPKEYLFWQKGCIPPWSIQISKQEKFPLSFQNIFKAFHHLPQYCLFIIDLTLTPVQDSNLVCLITMHNGGARGHFNFSQFWDLLTRCINFYSHSLIFPAILPPLIVYNLFIWWYRWVSGEEYYHFLYFAFSVAQTVQKLQVSCFFRSVNGSRESHYTLQHP